jgi:two-component system NarL family response regulator
MTHTQSFDSETPIRLLIVEDHHIVRQGLISLLQSVSGLEVVAEAPDGRIAAELYRRHLPDVVLMDLRMPVVSGVEAIQQLCREFPGAKVLVLTTFDGDEDVFRAMQAGARGYLLKGMEAQELITAIRRVHAGQSSLCSPVAQQLAYRMSTPELTPRELEVLETIVAGKSNREIASSLDVSEATVKTHLNSLFSKLDVVDRTQAAITAVQRGLVHLDFMADRLSFTRTAR